MPTIFDYVNANEIAAYYTKAPSNQTPFLGATLFPPRKQVGLDLSWIKGANGLPVALMPSEFDAKATLRDRIGFKKVETEMPFFREAMRIGEKDRQQLLNFVSTNNQSLILPFVNRIYDDAATLIAGAQVQPERMRMQLLSTGQIAISANRVNYDYNYGMQKEHKETLTGEAAWSDTAKSTPVQDIQKWQDQVEEDTGVRPTNAILSRKTLGYLMENKSIRLDLNPIGGENIIMTESMIRQYLSNKIGLNIAVYNKKFKDETGAVQQFFPDNVFTLIPDGNLGNTYFGTTPEEADLMNGNTDAQVRIVDTGIAVTTIKEPHPVNVETIVSGIMLPSFEQLDNIFIATVA
ncbi:major capsid protein [Shouchella clausii]|uniref:major capsid protein n=1 Tax=Shouchella TaxID=2893057 RepID=UPI0004E76294|nr:MULTISPECIES: major capsid protein [Shouchella]ALA55056.1 Phage major capsid protein [Shouchella clausii]MBU3231029.1 major capsid protein [Shouchella clausii]MBU3262896.1 major capsid protein [Shouchella clausii]MBU3505360.1 major capsid protein [Shouchella clausii]MBU3534926.1 major capsid protein [Shouchella clausii]